MLRAWIQASRPLSQANIAVPLLAGQALAFATTGRFEWWAFAAIHAFGLVDQLFIVWANDWADADADRDNDAPTLFSGGSRVVPEGKLTVRQLATASMVAAAALGAICVALTLADRMQAPLFFVAAIALLQAYSFRPLRLSYRGHGEVLQALGVGGVLPVFAYYVQVGELASFPTATLFPLLVLGYAGNVLTALPDQRADAAADKRTLVVRTGQRPARVVFVGLVALAIVLAPFVGPPLTPIGAAVARGPAALALVVAAAMITTPAADRGAMVRFVVAGGFAINLLLVGWSVALFGAL